MRRIPDWQYTGEIRPPFAVAPQPGQESVWDYPRPPRCELSTQTIRVAAGQRELARSDRAIRILETAGPPTYYLPRADIDMTLLRECSGESWCEWKGTARYWALDLGGDSRGPVGWDYPTPNEAFLVLNNCLAFYPGRVACWVDDEQVRPQAGGFYGGWVTANIVGPIKGDPGSENW